jgi:hypothetical protein
MAKKKAARKVARKTVDRGPLVTLRVSADPDGTAGTVTRAEPIEALAADWMYVLRNRPRWSDDEDLRDEIQERARQALNALGIDEAALARLAGAKSRQVEVGFHDARQPGGPPSPLDEAASAFPWEFVISSATRRVGRSHPIVITRWLPPTVDTRAPAMTGRTLPR